MSSGFGHTGLPARVKPYVKRQKNDATDAEAICEAVRRPTVRFVETKTPEQQSCLMLHRTRHLVVRQLNAVTNALRAHLAEFGIVAPIGRRQRSCEPYKQAEHMSAPAGEATRSFSSPTRGRPHMALGRPPVAFHYSRQKFLNSIGDSSV